MMRFRTEIDIPKADFEIGAAERMLFVGSCFADNLGRRFVENRFRATVNPFGVMYNPASILHTVEKCSEVRPRVAVFTLGTNHVYILKETGEIVDNCQKRPQRLFEERELSVDECAGYLQKAINLLKSQTAASGSSEGTLKVIITVSPIRYAKYGYHGSQLSKATLLLAADKLVKENFFFFKQKTAYEIPLRLVGSAREFEGKKPVWLIDGDGSFQMTSEELAAAFLDHAPVKIAILNNSVYGMVRQWQTLFYEHHYSQTNLLDGEAHGADGAAALVDGDAPLEVPDFIKLAEAYGCVGIRAFTEEEAIAAIEKANQINDRPVLIDFRVWKDAMVWPMVAAGASNDEVTYKPGIKPLAGGTPAPGTGPDEHATGVFEHETAAAAASEH